MRSLFLIGVTAQAQQRSPNPQGQRGAGGFSASVFSTSSTCLKRSNRGRSAHAEEADEALSIPASNPSFVNWSGSSIARVRR